MGIKVLCSGKRADTDKPVVFIANHASWLDIPVLGGCLKACFVSKNDVSHWLGINIIAKLGRTVFVSRRRSKVAQERNILQDRLAMKDDLILFPEGTSSDGARILPFRSAFFSLAEGNEPPVFQPVSIAYDLLDGLPVLRSNRAEIGWYGAMDLLPHIWRIAAHANIGATIRILPAVAGRFECRKAMAQEMWQIVANATASQRRPNRP